MAKKYGVSLGAAAMAFPLASDTVSTVLVGTAKPSSMQRNVDLFDAPIPDAAWAEFDALALRP